MGGNVHTLAVGGSGRWLCMHWPQRRQIAILDVIPGKVTHRIDLTEDDVLLTAGLSKLVVINAFSNGVQRFDLASGQLELTATLPEHGKVGLLACGSASSGPALIYWSAPPVGHSRFSWLDLKSWRIASMTSQDLPQQDVTALFASGDGRFFGLTSSGKAIVTIGENGASVTLHRVDFDQAIAGSTYDHLYITSSPPTVVGKDGRLQYEIQAQGRHRPFRYKLEHGPAGMKLTDEGVLSWTVPKQFESAEVDVITAVLDANGAEEFHSFRIQVVK